MTQTTLPIAIARPILMPVAAGKRTCLVKRALCWSPMTKRGNMLFTALVILIAAVAVLCLAGCAGTPNEQYKRAALAYDAVSVGATIAHDVGKISPSMWEKIQRDEVMAQADLAASYVWLQQNPNLANTPGLALPTLDPFNLVLNALSVDIQGLKLVPLNPPAGPTTQP